MYAQLGNTIFDGLKSFVTYSSDEEAVLVEYALIKSKPKLMGAAIGLNNLSISIYLHQEFCVVKDEIAKLRTSKNSFEILPLLWGNGTVEGSFVIATMSVNNEIMDTLGNLYAATVSLTLKESVADNTVTPTPSGFASGDKKPVTKSKRVNPQSCSKQISDVLNEARSYAKYVDYLVSAYQGTQSQNLNLYSKTGTVRSDANKIILATKTATSCVYNNSNIKNAAFTVTQQASNLSINAANGDVDKAKENNPTFQASVRALSTAMAGMVSKAVLKLPD